MEQTQVSVATCRGCNVDHAPGSAACPLTRVGTTIGSRYRLDRLLGFGGMGSVYEAENLQLGRRVALKLLHPAMAARPDMVERFRREARSVASLKHGGFAQVFALDTDESGQFFIEMELLDGEGIDRLIRREQAPIDRCIAFIESALEALAVAHAAGLVHRDLKPENLFVVGDHVKLLDFGIARIADDDRGLTSSGQFMGTIVYASPEQLRDAAAADTRSDVYSLGATAYEIVTRSTVCGGGSHADVITRIMTYNISRSIRAKRPDAPAWLDELVARSLAADPAQRFANAGEMLAALRAHEPAPVGAQPPARSKRVWVLGGLVVAAGAIAIALVAAGSAGSQRAAVAIDAAVVHSAAVSDASVPIDAIDAIDAAITKVEPPPPPANRPLSPRKKGQQLSEDGAQLMYAKKYSAAAWKFRDAISADPLPKYYFNLCVAQYMLGELAGAKEACNQATAHDPDDDLRTKLGRMLEKIEAESHP